MRFTVGLTTVAAIFVIYVAGSDADDVPRGLPGAPSTGGAASAPSNDDIKSSEARFDAAKGPERSVLGLELVSKLRSASESCYKSTDFPGALVHLNKALAIAGKIKGETFDLANSVQEIGQIKNAFDRFSKNAEARKALIIAYIAHGDGCNASDLLDDTVDQTTKTNVQLFGKGNSALSDPELLGLVKWLASDKVQANRLARETSLAYLRRHKEHDTDFAEAAGLFHQLNKKAGYILPDRKVSGSWEFNNGVISIAQAANSSRIILGPVPDKYSISVEVRLATEIATIICPVGSAMCCVHQDGGSIWIEMVKGQQYGRKKIPKTPKRNVTIKVASKGDSGAVEVLIDGKSQVSWSGAVSDLTPIGCWKIPDGEIGFGGDGTARFSNIAIDCSGK